jgi:hypothetical protein
MSAPAEVAGCLSPGSDRDSAVLNCGRKERFSLCGGDLDLCATKPGLGAGTQTLHQVGAGPLLDCQTVMRSKPIS